MIFLVPPQSQSATRTDTNSPPMPDAAAIAPPVITKPRAYRGAFQVFNLAGTAVYFHWSWFVVAFLVIRNRQLAYSSLVWNAAEFVAVFGLVLLHEFGHVLVCRRVGGTADRVLLWPLGGLAAVAPPPRPKATLWTIAAGPLVNLALAPVFMLLAFLTAPGAEGLMGSDLNQLFNALVWFNAVILVFNLLPIFPLDGGRILQAILWPWLGRATSLAEASVVGIAAAAGVGVWAGMAKDWWLTVVAGFLVLGAIGGVVQARLFVRLGQAVRRTDWVCPNCGTHPPVGDYWHCVKCPAWFDLFAPASNCPQSGGHATDGACPECGRQLGLTDWVAQASVEAGEPSDHGHAKPGAAVDGGA